MTWRYDMEPPEDRATQPTISHWAVLESGGGGMSPVQHWGTLANGWKFYLRLRSNTARLNVAPPETPMRQVPVYNPDFSFVDLSTAFEAGQDYTVPLCLHPEAQIDNVYPGEPLAGWFLTEEDLNQTFAACFDQIKQAIGLGDDMICPNCRDRRHDDCPRGTRCDCQHRVRDAGQESRKETNQ